MTSVCPSVTLVVCGHIIVKKWKTAYDSLHRTSCDMLFLGLTRVFPKWHLDQFSRFCMALQCDQHTDRQTHRPRISDQQEISNNWEKGCVALPSITLRCPSPQKCPSRGEVDSPFTTSYLRRNRPTTPNGISIDSAVFCKIHVRYQWTDRQTDDSTDTELSLYQ